MNFICISINHKTSSIGVLESLHLSTDEIEKFISVLKGNYLIEGVIVSTCNRTEIYGFPPENKIDNSSIINRLLEFKKVDGITKNNFSTYFSCGAVKHLFSVASGIESMVVGDSQILGQIKSSFEFAVNHEFANSITQKIFEAALRIGKRSIKETSISEGAVTISYAAVQVVEKIFANVNKKTALVIGAGETGELAAIHLKDKSIGKLFIANRTPSRAEELSKKVNGQVIPFDKLNDFLHQFDIIISATSSNSQIISFEEIKAAVNKRKGTPMVIMDIAVPRDIDSKVGELDNVFYHDLDSLNIIVQQNMQKRIEQIPFVQKIIMSEMVNFFGWYNTLDVVPTIKSLRNFFDEIRNDELDKLKHKVSIEDFEKIEDMSKRLIGRILHNPTVKLREYAEKGTKAKEVINNTILLNELFNLENRNNGKEISDDNNPKDEI
jgi:glutamyl-tRNA reductase